MGVVPIAEYFRGAHLKIERANEHIANITKVIAALPDAYAARIYIEPQTGDTFVEYGLNGGRKVISDLALIIGDAIHNLRSAIDYAWVGTLAKYVPPIIPNDSFPIHPTPDGVKGALKKRKIEEPSPVHDVVFTWIKPYNGGNDSVRAIHILDRQDKHRLLLPLLNVVFQRVEVQDPGGSVQRFDWVLTLPGPYRRKVAKGSQIKNQGEISVTVIFHQGTPTHDANVLSVLSDFEKTTISVVELLQGV